jgi:hypothetical protein
MMKFEQYYSNIRAQRQQLAGQFPDQCCLVVAGGAVAEVPLDIAARLLVEGTHALATDAQARAFREAQIAARARSAPATTLDEVRAQFTAIMRERGNHVSR